MPTAAAQSSRRHLPPAQPQSLPAARAATARWWRVGMMWLVVGGPAAVVVASFATLALAILHPDPVLVAEPSATASERPAIEMRNHAATAVAPPLKH